MAAKPKPSLGLATKAAAGVVHTKQQQTAAIERSIRITSWILGMFIALLPPIWSYFNAYALYGDNKDIKELYIEFATKFFVSGELLWIAITLLATSLMDTILKSFLMKGKNITLFYRILLILSIFFVVWGEESSRYSPLDRKKLPALLS
jgi:predicted metal-binding membrane protein